MVNIESNSDPDLQAVIFDCDGVLVNTEPLHYRAFQEVLAPLGLGHDFESYLEHFVGFDDRDAFIYAFRQAGLDLAPTTLGRLIEAKALALKGPHRTGGPQFSRSS